MSRLHFAQISDIHIRKDYSSGLLHDMFDSLISPDEKLIQTLQELKKEQLDFIVITGDLVHEGNEADYQHFQNILNSAELAVPVLLALGNHDRKRAFCQVFHKELKNGRYFYFHQIREWKIIVLDSAGEDHGLGEINTEQMEWLEHVCAKEDKILVFMHHPVWWEDSLLCLGENSERLRKFLSQQNIRGVFCGHVHRNSMKENGAFSQFTAESMACGFDYDENGIKVRERSGYIKAFADEAGMRVDNCFWHAKEVYEIPGNTLRNILDKKE
ncbi:ser/Thr protein phosphatase family protein [Roseburia sp. CAG:182]|nr:ser/Thr protein phosphatase family protein [Roseburia sp. CAG:182]